MGKITYNEGDVFGKNNNIIFIHTLPSDSAGNAKGLVKCYCSKEFIAQLRHIRSGNTTSCGCYNKSLTTKHGLSNHKHYKMFTGMMFRCYNPISKDYQKYHSKGIIVENYLQNVTNYIEYIDTLPLFKGQPIGKLSIDRINNDGNYTRGNLRWADNIIQETNKQSNSQEYTGVRYNEFSHTAFIAYRGIKYHIGSFPSADEAVLARNKFIQDRGFPHPVQVLN